MGVLVKGLLSLFGLGGVADAAGDAVETLGVGWMVKSAVENLLNGAGPGGDVAFARFMVLGGVAILLGLLALHLWRGESWAGKFRAAWWLWLVTGCVAAFLVLAGVVDLTATRVARAYRNAERTAAQLPLPEPERKAIQRRVAHSLLTSGPSGRANCAGCE